MKKKTTIVDVAKRAGVAPSTVSHVIHGTASISEQTREKVQKAIDELRYSPNAIARALRKEQSGLIGVVLQDISSEFYARCAAAILEEARKDEYVVLFCDASFQTENKRKGVEALLQQRVDGILFIGGNDDEDIIELVREQKIPVLLGDRRLGELPSVTFDNRTCISEMVCLLYEAGYRRFAYMAEPVSFQTNLQERYQGYLDGIGQCEGVESKVWFDPRLQFEKIQTGHEIFYSYFTSSRPEVILTSNDMIAEGLVSAAARYGIRVPEELGVVGFNDNKVVKYYTPPLTTVAQDTTLFGRECYRAFKQLLSFPERKIAKVLPQQIIVRESARIPEKLREKWRTAEE